VVRGDLPAKRISYSIFVSVKMQARSSSIKSSKSAKRCQAMDLSANHGLSEPLSTLFFAYAAIVTPFAGTI
jgi:hypothetical protein